MVSAEEFILSKLERGAKEGSERQVRDALAVAVAQWKRLNRAYLQHWAAELGVQEALLTLLQQAETLTER